MITESLTAPQNGHGPVSSAPSALKPVRVVRLRGKMGIPYFSTRDRSSCIEDALKKEKYILLRRRL